MSFMPAQGQFAVQGHKARAPRRKVCLPVRMRVGSGWSDVRLVDVSLRGLQVKCAAVPARGTYVEVRRGSHVIVARVVWAKHDRFGAQTQEPVRIDALTSAQDNAPAGDTPSPTRYSADRRSEVRPQATAQAHERSRVRGRALEFGIVTVAAATLALWCVSMVQSTLGSPLTMLTTAMG